MLPRLAFAFLLLALTPVAELSAADDSLTVFPARLELRGPVHVGRLLVQRSLGSEVAGQVAGDLNWSTSDTKVAECQNGVVTPRGNGKAVITVEQAGKKATAEVVVSEFDKPH